MFEKLREGFNGLVDRITTTELKAEQLRLILQKFKLILIESDVAVSIAEHVCMEIEKQLDGVKVKRLEDRRAIVEKTLHKVLFDILTVDREKDLVAIIEEKRKTKEPCVIVFVGINGTGKTTTIAKIARLLMKHGYSVVLACSDTYRAGAIEQLEVHARRLGTRMIKHQYGSDAASVAFDAVQYAKTHGINAVLIDTAGRMQTDINLMNELEKIKRVINPDLTILTVDALTGNDAVVQAEEFHKSVGIDGIILTKVDADVKGGAALSVAYITGKQIMFIGTGQEYKDLKEFKPERFMEMITNSSI